MEISTPINATYRLNLAIYIKKQQLINAKQLHKNLITV